MIAGLLLIPVVTPWLRLRPPPEPVAREIRAAVRPADGDIARFYRAEGYRPLWIVGRTVRPDAVALISALRASGKDGLNPASYQVQALANEAAGVRGDPKALARTELALSRAYVAYAHDLHHPAASAGLSFVDPAVPMPRTGAFALLEQADHDPSPTAALQAVERVNPIYAALRDDWNARRAADGDDRTTRLLRINMERARALPPDLGQRYILVNPAAETLWTYAGGQHQERMRVVVGKLSEPTPSMIGLIRYALFNPYWNVPPDLVRDKIAPKVLGHGVAYFKDQRFEALDSFKSDAAVLDPAKIDWKAVASGSQVLRVRQRPGLHNMMGTVKFMLPNRLGIYLHDTPMRGLFGDASRTDSAGCVRLQHPAKLAAWLFGQKQSFNSNGSPDQRVNLPKPVPVYILYLTAQPGADGISYLPDIYSRDPGVKAAMGLSAR